MYIDVHAYQYEGSETSISSVRKLINAAEKVNNYDSVASRRYTLSHITHVPKMIAIRRRISEGPSASVTTLGVARWRGRISQGTGEGRRRRH